jgi:glycosyltransferase involved in cell wall biosynthesis
MKRIGVLFGIDSMACGGTELQLRGLIDRLDRTRFEPHLLTLRPQDVSLLPPDCSHLALDVPALARPAALAELLRAADYMRRHRVSVVQTFFQDSTIFGLPAARLAGVAARLASFRDLGFWRTPAQERTLRAVYRLATGFVVNSAAVLDHFHQADGLDPGRFTVIPNGVDVARFPFRPPAVRPLTVGMLGNLNREVKRVDLFVEAAGLLAARYPDVRWEVVGDGHLRQGMESRAEALGLKSKVLWHGQISDVVDVLGRWDIGVLCSDSEGFSNAVLEYMLCGCAVVATDVGGNREAIRPGQTGELVPPGQFVALAGCLERLLQTEGMARALAEAARQDAETRYSWGGCVAAHEELYRRITTAS